MTTTFTQLTAPGVTSSVKTKHSSNNTFQYTVANKDTNVIVRAEGSLDDTLFFVMDSSDTTKTADGTFALFYSNKQVSFMRFRFVSEAGGTAATIDVKHVGGN